MGGEITTADSEGITSKSHDGSTTLVFFSGTASIARQAEGSAADLAAGTNVLVTGVRNADGSATANNVQNRPAGAEPSGPGDWTPSPLHSRRISDHIVLEFS